MKYLTALLIYLSSLFGQTAKANKKIAELVSQLKGDDTTDETVAIQNIIDQAYLLKATQINFPAKTFKVGNVINVYGSNLTISGQGNVTVFDMFGNFDGQGGNGVPFWVRPTFKPEMYFPMIPITSDLIIFKGSVPFKAGEDLFLTNGRGSVLQLEAKFGGAIVDPGAFNELAPCEHVQVKSVTQDLTGNSLVHLEKAVVGVDEYFNTLPAGAAPSEKFLHVREIDRPADQIMIKNIAIHWSNMNGDVSIYSHYSRNLTLDSITILNSTSVGGRGGFGMVGTMYAHLNNIHTTHEQSIGLNSTKFSLVENSITSNISSEEGDTDAIIRNNQLGGNALSFRTNDMVCRRILFQNNTLQGGAVNAGAIGLWEGNAITVDKNTVTPPLDSIWMGTNKNCVITNNVATNFANYGAPSNALITGNSWQK